MASHADSNVALDATGSEAAEHVERGVTVEAVGAARAVRGQIDADDRNVVEDQPARDGRTERDDLDAPIGAGGEPGTVGEPGDAARLTEKASSAKARLFFLSAQINTVGDAIILRIALGELRESPHEPAEALVAVH